MFLQRQYVSPSQHSYSNYGNAYGNSNQGPSRGMKRQGPVQPWADRAKRFAGNPSPVQKPSYPTGGAANFRPKFTPKAPAVRMEREAAFDVGPVEPPAARPAEVFRGKESASRSLLGRLEVLLGRLVREMRDQFYGPPHNIFLTPVQTKALKERLRDRIHRMMLGKPITSNQTMYDMYRKVHTSKGDLRLLNNIISNPASENKPAQPSEGAAKPTESAAKPEPAPTTAQKPPKVAVAKETVGVGKFIRYRIHGMLETKLDEIFAKLYKLCEEDAALALKEPVPTKTESGEEAKNEESQGEKETPVEILEGDKSAEGDKPAEGDKSAEDDKSTQDDKPIEEGKPAEGVEPATEVGETADDVGEESVEEVQTDIEMKEVKEQAGKKKELNTEELFEFLMDRAMRKKLAQILPRYRNYMLAMIARDKQLAHLGVKGIDDPTPPKRPALLFAKILGKPSLPARNLMKDFLAQFQCASIKKHKNIYNLLFVGVTTEEDLSKLIACDGTVIGGKKLDIRPSIKDTLTDKEKKPSEGTAQTNGAADSVAVEENGESANASLGNVIDDLGNEINSLLMAINETGDAPKADNSEMPQEQGETGQKEPDQEIVDITGEQSDGSQEAVETEKREESEEKGTPIRTRRSSRLPQKN